MKVLSGGEFQSVSNEPFDPLGNPGVCLRWNVYRVPGRPYTYPHALTSCCVDDALPAALLALLSSGGMVGRGSVVGFVATAVVVSDGKIHCRDTGPEFHLKSPACATHAERPMMRTPRGAVRMIRATQSQISRGLSYCSFRFESRVEIRAQESSRAERAKVRCSRERECYFFHEQQGGAERALSYIQLFGWCARILCLPSAISSSHSRYPGG